MPDNLFEADDEDEGLNDYVEVLKSTIGGLNLLIDTLMGNRSTGSRPRWRSSGGRGRTGRKLAARE